MIIRGIYDNIIIPKLSHLGMYQDKTKNERSKKR